MTEEIAKLALERVGFSQEVKPVIDIGIHLVIIETAIATDPHELPIPTTDDMVIIEEVVVSPDE